MSRFARIAVAVLAFVVVLGGWAAWAHSGTAPSVVSVAFDQAGKFLLREDPQTRCWEREQSEFGTVFSFIGARRCYSFEPQRHFVGIYIDEFEGQRFLEDAKPASQYRPKDKVWIDFDEMTDLERTPQLARRSDSTRIWHVSFRGRKTSERGRYGHFGISSEEIVVDRMLSARLVGTYEGYLPDSVLDRDAAE